MRQLLATLAALGVVAASCASGSGDVTTIESERSATAGSNAEPPADTAAPGVPTTDGSTPSTPGSLDWTRCDGNVLFVPLECATLRVPVDHDDPDGPLIDIGLVRAPATDPGDRIGSLVFNPGGPGGSGIDFLKVAVGSIPSEVAARFDLVGFDPRGVGASTAVDCDIEIDDNVTLLAEGDDEGWARLVEEAMARPSESCPADVLELAPHVGTNNAARDLDLIRAALGDERLSYVGFSYGTRLGATYAELFPERVRALVLDGAVRPTTDFASLDLEQGEGFDRALENFAAACDADEDCVVRELGPTLDVLDGLEGEIAAAGGFATGDPSRTLTPGELALGVAASLYSKEAWPLLARALRLAASEDDGSLLQALADTYAGRNPDGTYDNSTEANFFINCADDGERPDEAAVRARGESAAARSKHFAEFLRATTGCIGAPAPIDPLIVGPAAGAAPILVIGSTGDPATPYEWSVALAEFLDSGVLYTVEAEGHTAYTSIDCVEPVVNAYLIDLTLPAEGSSCADDATDFFAPAGESEFDQLLALFACLRANGADIPELSLSDLLADPTGEQLVELFDVSDPAFLDAAFQCADLLDELAGGL